MRGLKIWMVQLLKRGVLSVLTTAKLVLEHHTNAFRVYLDIPTLVVLASQAISHSITPL